MGLQTSEKQFEFWTMRRNGTPNITIANILGISRQAVSRALHVMDKKIDLALKEMANANQILIEKINIEWGILFGWSVPLQTQAIIFISTKKGIQVWYEHEGECTNCQRYAECIELLWDYADELGIIIQLTEDPTKMAEELFEKMKVIV